MTCLCILVIWLWRDFVVLFNNSGSKEKDKNLIEKDKNCFFFFFTFFNDAVDTIVGLFFTPGVDGVRSFRLLSEIHRLNVRKIICLEFLFVLGIHREILTDEHFIGELQGDVLNILQEEHTYRF